MPDRTQIGPAVNARLWERFRKDVEARKGAIRGNLGEELDNAIREYLKDGPTDQEQEIINRLDRLESAVGAVPADGGTDTSDAETHTHAEKEPLPEPDPVPDSKPAANASTDKKVAYLAEQIREQTALRADEPGTVVHTVLQEAVKEEYAFRADTAKRYIDRLIDEFGLREHPEYDKQYVTEPKYEELMQERREEIEAEVSDGD